MNRIQVSRKKTEWYPTNEKKEEVGKYENERKILEKQGGKWRRNTLEETYAEKQDDCAKLTYLRNNVGMLFIL